MPVWLKPRPFWSLKTPPVSLVAGSKAIPVASEPPGLVVTDSVITMLLPARLVVPLNAVNCWSLLGVPVSGFMDSQQSLVICKSVTTGGAYATVWFGEAHSAAVGYAPPAR